MELSKIKLKGSVYDIKDTTAREGLSNKQDKLVSGTNIKTINGESILGSGDIVIESNDVTIATATTSTYGVTKLTTATNSTSTTLAATASAVKSAYDLANSYKGTVTGVKINGTTKNPSSGVIDLGTVITSHQDISGKQDKLVSGTNIKTINGTSILGSGNIVISGGGGSSSGNGAYGLVEHGTSDTTFALTPNTFHVWDEVAELTLSFGEETAGVANEYLFQFTSGSEPTVLTLPDNIVWANDEIPVIESNCVYQISVLKGFATIMSFYKPALMEFSITIYDMMTWPPAEYVETYYYMDGMTWEEWINSEYNTNDNYGINEDNSIYHKNYNNIQSTEKEGDYVYTYEKITSFTTYYIE